MCYGEVVSSAIQTARREGLPCASCGRRIIPGSEYVMHSTLGYDDGRLSAWKLCRTCGKVAQARWDLGDGSCPLDLREDFMESSDPSVRRDLLSRAWQSMRKRYRRAKPDGDKERSDA